MSTIPAALSATLAVALLLAGCEERTPPGLKGERNAELVFHALCVDQDGRPLPDVWFMFELEIIPDNWTFENRGADREFKPVRIQSGPDGRFSFPAKCQRIRVKRINKLRYRSLHELDIGFEGPSNNQFYLLIASGDLWHRTDEANPAVFVLVGDDVREVRAMPSRGGSDIAGIKGWRRNEPTWPREPSLKDVVYVPPTTQPSTQPATTSPAGA